MKNNILIITGEPSGDKRAGEVLKDLKILTPGYSFWGIGGDSMADQDVELIEHIRDLSIIGVWEVIKHLPKIHAQYKTLTEEIKKRKPAIAILVDYPGFNLKVAAFLHKNNIPVLYYVIPQVWAWGANRIKLIKKYVDKALVLFQFEEDLLKEHNIVCKAVGHPLIDRVPEIKNQKQTDDPFTVALLPGSRIGEILTTFVAMLGAAEKLSEYKKNIRFIVAKNSVLSDDLYTSILEKHKDLDISFVQDDTFTALDKSDFVIATSGTVTLEATVMEKPMLIVYRTSFLTAFLARMFIKVSFLGLVNIISGRQIVPELYQQDVNPEKIFETVKEIISDETRMLEIKKGLRKVTGTLGEKGAAKRTAIEISNFIKEKGL